MKYIKRNGKYVLEKEGVYFALTLEQVDDLAETIAQIQAEARPVFMCVVNGPGEYLDTCVWDDGDPEDCEESARGICKEDCMYWQRQNLTYVKKSGIQAKENPEILADPWVSV